MGYEYIEIFDSRIGKFTDIVTLPNNIGITYLSNGNYQPDLLLDDGRVLLSAGLSKHEGFSYHNAEIYQIYDPSQNTITKVGTSAICRTYTRYKEKFDKTYVNHTPDKMYQLNSEKIAAYCSIGNNRNEMEIIDIKNNTISEPIKKGDSNYIMPPKENKSYNFHENLVNSYKKLYPNLNLDEMFYFSIFPVKLTNERYMLISDHEVDYGINTKSLNLSHPPYRNSWFSPIYEYNIKTKELIKKNEYLRSSTGLIYHLKDTSKLLIIGGDIRDEFPPINQNAKPKDIPLKNRVLYPDWAIKATKKVYIYVY